MRTADPHMLCVIDSRHTRHARYARYACYARHQVLHVIELALDGQIAEMGRDLDEINVEILVRDRLLRSQIGARDAEIGARGAKIGARAIEIGSRGASAPFTSR